MEIIGVKVLIKETNEYGYILRRLNSQAYEIWPNKKNESIILSPEEFVEIEEGENK